MKSELVISLPVMEEDSLQTSSLDTSPQLQLSGIPTLAKYSEREKIGSQICQCGKGMSDCSIHPSTVESWTRFMQDSLAQTLAKLEDRQACLREPDQVFTEKYCVSLAWFDQSESSWKTYQQSLVSDWEPYSETWPRWGMTVDGVAYGHLMSERNITETVGSHWPTPTTRDWKDSSPKEWQMENSKGLLGREIHKGIPNTGGVLSPMWVEWLMGFPVGWTGLKDLVTRKPRSKQQ